MPSAVQRAPTLGPGQFQPPVVQPRLALQSDDERDARAQRGSPSEDRSRTDNARDEADCERIYNDRNCCHEEDQCRDARSRLLRNPITSITLDVTPTYKPNATTREEADTARIENLAKSPSRQWRNRSGAIVAVGQLTDFQLGRVHIVQDDGTTTQVWAKALSDDDMCFVTAWWGIPTPCPLEDIAFAGRNWIPSTLTWKASALCHKPLYFEEVQVERYGHTTGPVFQPLLSGAHFFINLASLPYQRAIHPLNECQYALGYYRPGNCAPWLLPPVPLSLRGALAETTFVLGSIYALP